MELHAAGLRTIQISLESANPEINDKIRGKGTFERTVRGIKNAINSGLSVYLAIVIMKENMRDFPYFFDFAVDIGASGVKVQTLIDSGLASINKPELEISSNELTDEIKKLWRLKKSYDGKIEIMLPLIPEILKEASEAPEYYNKNSSCLGCQPGLSTIRVNNIGNVRACGGMVNAPSLGNVFDTTLEQIWNGSEQLVRWRNEAELSNGNSATSCGSICGKGCRSAASPKFAKDVR